MSTTNDVRQRVLAFLDANGLSHWPEGETDRLRFSSALVEISMFSLGQQHVITLRAPVLSDLPPSIDTTGILRELNRLNAISHFGKWVYYDRERLLALEYDLLGDHLQEDELITAVAVVARLADAEDDRLQALLGGGSRAVED